MRKEAGFTLIELLSSLAIVSILAMNSVQLFSILRQKAYTASTDKLIHDSRNSIEALMTNYNEGTQDWFSALSDANGSVRGWHWGNNAGEVLNDDAILPGLRVKKDTRMNASWNTWCSSNSLLWGCGPSDRCCITEAITAYHCKGKTVKMTFKWNNGDNEEFEWQNGGC